MKVCGIDTASSGLAAISLAINGEPIRSVVWKPKDKHASVADVLDQQFNWMQMRLKIFKPDVVSVEELEVFLNKKTIRAMGRHEGISLLAAKRSGAIVLNPSIGQARRVVFGNGQLSKDDAWAAFRKKYPDLKMLAKNSGGTDQVDAYTHALAAVTILEQR